MHFLNLYLNIKLKCIKIIIIDEENFQYYKSNKITSKKKQKYNKKLRNVNLRLQSLQRKLENSKLFSNNQTIKLIITHSRELKPSLWKF